MSSAARPKRTYGRRTPAAPSSPPPSMIYAPSSSGTLLYTPPSSPAFKIKGKSRVLEAADVDDDPFGDAPSTPTHSRKRRRASSPPVLTSLPPLGARDSNRPDAESSTKQATLKGFFAPVKRGRADAAESSKVASASARDASPSLPKRESTPTVAARPQRMHQLQFMANAMQTCHECGMSYLRGSDEADHKRHHTRVTRGIPWNNGRKEAKVIKDRIPLTFGVKKERIDLSVVKAVGSSEADSKVRALSLCRSNTLPLFSAPVRKVERYYRIIALDASTPGRLVADILATVDKVLSAPALPPAILAHCKLFLAVTASDPPALPNAKRRPGPKPKEGGAERVVAVVVSQPIKWAMRVLREGEESGRAVDSGDGVMCDPAQLPTPLGIHRLFTVPAYRGCGLAAALLDTAASETVYGCKFDPTRGQVAFSQPTESGKRVMERWGRGGIRVFVDDESQL